MQFTLQDITKLAQKYQDIWPDLLRQSLMVSGLIFGAYLLASSLTAASVNFLTKSVLEGAKSVGSKNGAKLTDFSVNFNHREMRKIVMARNLFNSKGDFPSDAEDKIGGQDGETKFDENAPCAKTNLNIELIGTIYLGARSSLATVKEKGYNEADIYRAGDAIIGQPQALVHRIDREVLIINNAGSKECLELEKPKLLQNTDSMTSSSPQPKPSGSPRPGESSGEGNRFTLPAAFVEQSLGPGFSKILESGRLVPHHKDNQMIGFKLIGVKPESLWKRINLSSGDVITAVNDISMARPDQGFAVYQALQDSREIRIEVLKGASTPATYTVEIK